MGEPNHQPLPEGNPSSLGSASFDPTQGAQLRCFAGTARCFCCCNRRMSTLVGWLVVCLFDSLVVVVVVVVVCWPFSKNLRCDFKV